MLPLSRHRIPDLYIYNHTTHNTIHSETKFYDVMPWSAEKPKDITQHKPTQAKEAASASEVAKAAVDEIGKAREKIAEQSAVITETRTQVEASEADANHKAAEASELDKHLAVTIQEAKDSGDVLNAARETAEDKQAAAEKNLAESQLKMSAAEGKADALQTELDALRAHLRALETEEQDSATTAATDNTALRDNVKEAEERVARMVERLQSAEEAKEEAGKETKKAMEEVALATAAEAADQANLHASDEKIQLLKDMLDKLNAQLSALEQARDTERAAAAERLAGAESDLRDLEAKEAAGTQLTCLTSTQIQILTPDEPQTRLPSMRSALHLRRRELAQALSLSARRRVLPRQQVLSLLALLVQKHKY